MGCRKCNGWNILVAKIDLALKLAIIKVSHFNERDADGWFKCYKVLQYVVGIFEPEIHQTLLEEIFTYSCMNN